MFFFFCDWIRFGQSCSGVAGRIGKDCRVLLKLSIDPSTDPSSLSTNQCCHRNAGVRVRARHAVVARIVADAARDDAAGVVVGSGGGGGRRRGAAPAAAAGAAGVAQTPALAAPPPAPTSAARRVALQTLGKPHAPPPSPSKTIVFQSKRFFFQSAKGSR